MWFPKSFPHWYNGTLFLRRETAFLVPFIYNKMTGEVRKFCINTDA